MIETPDEIALRIKDIMNFYRLSQQSFAEILNVRSPLLTHIFMGRNSASVTIIQTLLTKFPEVNPDYLLLGKGSLLRSQSCNDEK